VQELYWYTSSFNTPHIGSDVVIQEATVSAILLCDRKLYLNKAWNCLWCMHLHCLAGEGHRLCYNQTGVKIMKCKGMRWICGLRKENEPSNDSCTYSTAHINRYIMYWCFVPKKRFSAAFTYPLIWKQAWQLQTVFIINITLPQWNNDTHRPHRISIMYILPRQWVG
jgi:hypothetical protein